MPKGRVKDGGLSCNLLQMIGQFSVWVEEPKRYTEWPIKGLLSELAPGSLATPEDGMIM